MTHVSVGTLVVALAALKYNGEGKRDKARSAFLVLQCLVSSNSLPSTDTAENAITLLRLQGLRRISGLLCPRICPLDSSTGASTDGMQEGGLPLVFLWSICRAGDAHNIIRLWHVKCFVCRSGQCMQLCPSIWIHSPVLTNFVANTEADQHNIDRYRDVQR